MVPPFFLFILEPLKETWIDIKGFEGFYQVSNLGRIKSLDRTILNSRGRKVRLRSKIMGSSKSGDYRMIDLRKVGESKMTLIHRLVALHFIPNPENKPCVNHKNGNKKDNRALNLEWATYSENQKHAYKNGLNDNRGERSRTNTLLEEDIRNIRKLRSKGKTHKEIAVIVGTTRANITKILNGYRWGHVK